MPAISRRWTPRPAGGLPTRSRAVPRSGATVAATRPGGSRSAGLRDRKKRRTRVAHVEAAYRLFDAQGYDRTTTAEIAAAADVSVATLYKYFPTKERLVFTDDGRDLLAAATGADPRRVVPGRRAACRNGPCSRRRRDDHA